MPGTAPDLHSVFADRIGTVVTFDDAEGAGWVSDGDGRRWWFHCTRIADGSRTIPLGATARYRVMPGPAGLEAVDLVVIETEQRAEIEP